MNFSISAGVYRYLVLLCYCLVNGLFVYKYAPSYSGLLALVYMLLAGLAYRGYCRWFAVKNSGNKKMQPYLMAVMVVVFVCGIFIIKHNIPALTVKVDRWSALYYWSQYLFDGSYPYAAKTHLGQYASPFPVWEMLHIPFYFLGDEIFAHIVMVLFLFFFLLKFKRRLDGLLLLGLLFMSPCYWWEVTVRSDLMNNLMLSALFIVYCEAYLSEKNGPANFRMLGLLSGLLFCSRLFVAFPLGIYFISKLFRWKRPDAIAFILFALIGALLPMLPFFYWDSNMFITFKYSPVHLQTQLGNVWIALIGVLFLAFCSFSWHNFAQYLGCVTIVLFLFVGLRFTQSVLGEGWFNAVFLDGFDISYFNVCIPFALFFLTWRFSPVIDAP